MTRRLTPLIDDPETEPAVRDLLQAGREADREASREQRVADYDFEAGLRRHMAVIAAGAPMPDWAKGLETSGTGASTATATSAATGAGASAALGGVVWLVVPVVTAAVVAAAMWARNAEPVAPSGATAPAVGVHPVQPSGSSANVPEAAPVVAENAAMQGAAEPEAVLPAEPAQPTVRARANRAGTGSKVRIADATPSTLRGGSATSSSTGSRSSSGDIFSRARPAVASSASTSASSGEPVELAPSEQPLREAPAREQQASTEPTPKPAARLDDARLEREMGMLAVAQRVIHSDPGRTLSLVRQSAREFGDTMFAPERGQLELLALVKLGKLDEAKRLARPYLARYPNGPFSDRVRRALASGRVDR